MNNSMYPNLSAHSRVFIDENLSKHTYIRIGGKAKYFIKVGSIIDLKKLLSWVKSKNIPYIILGAGSNVLVDDDGWNGLVISFKDSMNNLQVKQNKIVAGSGVMLPKLSKVAQKHSLAGLEFAIGIPGTLGGALYSNAGISNVDQISKIIKNVTVLRDSKLLTIDLENIKFDYRYSSLKENCEIIVEAELSLSLENQEIIDKKMQCIMQYRKLTQPASTKNAGSIFKNPADLSAGKLIEEANLKGVQIGGAMVSSKHSNFIVNEKNATAKDVADLMMIIQNKVYENTGILLQPEVEWLGNKKIPNIFQ
jgi:UDP-N-acetylmuramate dehydrogenase